MTTAWPRALLAAVALAACAEEPAPPRAIPRWECPPEWVPHRLGGCGPAVVLCRPDGGAQEGVCSGLDLTRPRPVPYADGGAGATFYLLPDGGIGGAWPEALPTNNPQEPERVAPSAEFLPEAGIPSCPARWTRHKDLTCEPVFPDDCPAGAAFPDLGALPSGERVLHVRQGTIETPDGSEGAPYATIARALAAVVGETWVRVAPGDYRENLTLAGNVHLVGCRHRTTVESVDASRPTVLASQPGTVAELRGLTVQGGGVAVEVQSGAQLLLQSADLRDNHTVGVYARHTQALLARPRVTLREVSIAGTRTRPGDGVGGVGISAQGGATVLVERSLVRATQGVGVFASGADARGTASRVELTDCVLRGASPPMGSRAPGYGLSAQGGGEVLALRVLVAGYREAGAHAQGASPRGAPSRMTLTDSVVRDTEASAGQGGVGVAALGGGTVLAMRTLVLGNREAGAFASGSGGAGGRSTVTLTGCVVADTRPSATDGRFGYGLRAEAGGVVAAASCALRGNRDVGALALGSGPDGTRSRILLAVCVVRDTQPRSADRSLGVGVSAQGGGQVFATGALFLGNHEAGVFARGEDPAGVASRVDLLGCTVRGTLPRASDLQAGYGASAELGGVLVAQDSLFDGNRDVAVASSGVAGERPSRVELRSCVVRGTLPLASSERRGYGLVAVDGAELAAVRTLVEENRAVGVAVSGTAPGVGGSRVTLTDSAVRDTQDPAFGIGIAVVGGARLEATRVLVSRSRTGAVLAAGVGTTLALDDLFVSETAPPDGRGGVGLALSGGARGEARRLVLLGTHAAALALIPGSALRSPVGGAQLEVWDAFVRRVGPGTLDFDACRPGQRVGPLRAYGAYVASSSTLALHRALLFDGATAVAAQGGAVLWRDGVAAGFARYFVRGSSLVTAPPDLLHVATPTPEDLLLRDDPTLPNESLPEPVLDPERGPLECRPSS
ncbi:MAG: hypothetical protein HY909_26500 [Deltaproteobacteria bacterium]|nr:hypothetical protein [Deltaproteobacteria bacterium]